MGIAINSARGIAARSTDALPTLRVDRWQSLLGRDRTMLEGLLGDYLPRQRWFADKTRTIERVEISDALAMDASQDSFLAMLKVSFTDGSPGLYTLPLAARASDTPSPSALARLSTSQGDSVLVDATADPSFAAAFTRQLLQDSDAATATSLVVRATSALAPARAPSDIDLGVRLLGAEQSNTSYLVGDRYVAKLNRRLADGLDPDVEVGRFLTERARFDGSPALYSELEYTTSPTRTVGMLQQFAPNNGDGWAHTLRGLSQLLTESDATVREASLSTARSEAEQLGRQTARLHRALASDSVDSRFAPVPISDAEWAGRIRAMRDDATSTFALLEPKLDDRTRSLLRSSVDATFDRLARLPAGQRGRSMRVHGDYHLGQVLKQSGEFSIVDFGGEPARSLTERTAKRPALTDVAGMVRSLHYASEQALLDLPDDAARSRARPIAQRWHAATTSGFIDAYLAEARSGGFLPPTDGAIKTQLDALIVDKALYELRYEANNRPHMLGVATRGLQNALAAAG